MRQPTSPTLLHSCLVLEDSLSDQLSVEIVLEQYPQIVVTYVSTPTDWLEQVKNQKFDLYIVDIMLGSITTTGIELLRQVNDPQAWVLITSSLDSRDYYPQYSSLICKKFYLKKPLDEYVFRTYIESFLFEKNTTGNTRKGQHLSIKQGNYIHIVPIDEICIIFTQDHATTIQTTVTKYVTYVPLKTYEQELKAAGFERINRNTLINIGTIKRINIKGSYIEVGNQKISVSRSYKRYFTRKKSDKDS